MPAKYAIKSLKLFMEYMGDMIIYMKYNNFSPLPEKSIRQKYQLLINAHKIEKGLSLSNPRPLFGKDVIYEIASLHNSTSNGNSMEKAMAKGAITEYAKLFENELKNDRLLNSTTSDIIKSNILNQTKDSLGGTTLIDHCKLISSDDAEAFLTTRHSARVFSKDPVSKELIDRIINISRSAPSQCNRQSVRIHIYQNYQQVQKLLGLQGGSRGFSEEVGNLFIVSSDITGWQGPQQRNQCYVDGGLQAMMTLLGCHAVGIAACALNLAVKHSTEAEIKRIGNIPDSHRLIMYIAFGKYENEWHNKVAKSPRRSLTEVSTYH